MTHVVTGNCDLCRFTDCVATCPVACFHADAGRVYIDPAVCIDCGACIPACPVHAIYDSLDMPDDQRHWIEINATGALKYPIIDETQTPLPTADKKKAELGF